jgi:hypothetical protein
MMPSLRTTHSSFTLLIVVACVLQTSTILGMTVPFSSSSSSSSYSDENTQWHETASGIPTTGAGWISLSNGQEFQPAEHEDPEKREQLVRAQRRFLGYRDNFVDGTETFYSERSQAWRLLGVYIDCDAQNNEGGDDHKDRTLKQNSNNGKDRKLGGDDVAACQRYMLWAAVSQVETFVSHC